MLTGVQNASEHVFPQGVVVTWTTKGEGLFGSGVIVGHRRALVAAAFVV